MRILQVYEVVLHCNRREAKTSCFFDNNKEFEEYINGLNVTIDGMFVSYHGSDVHCLKNIQKYATVNAKEYSPNGGGKAFIDNFTVAFVKYLIVPYTR